MIAIGKMVLAQPIRLLRIDAIFIRITIMCDQHDVIRWTARG